MNQNRADPVFKATLSYIADNIMVLPPNLHEVKNMTNSKRVKEIKAALTENEFYPDHYGNVKFCRDNTQWRLKFKANVIRVEMKGEYRWIRMDSLQISKITPNFVVSLIKSLQDD